MIGAFFETLPLERHFDGGRDKIVVLETHIVSQMFPVNSHVVNCGPIFKKKRQEESKVGTLLI